MNFGQRLSSPSIQLYSVRDSAARDKRDTNRSVRLTGRRGALDEAGELGLGDAPADDAVARLVALADPSPIHRPVGVGEVGSDDHAT